MSIEENPHISFKIKQPPHKALLDNLQGFMTKYSV